MRHAGVNLRNKTTRSCTRHLETSLQIGLQSGAQYAVLGELGQPGPLVSRGSDNTHLARPAGMVPGNLLTRHFEPLLCTISLGSWLQSRRAQYQSFAVHHQRRERLLRAPPHPILAAQKSRRLWSCVVY